MVSIKQMLLNLEKLCVFSFVDFNAFTYVASTHDQNVFSFYPDNRVCHGFEEVLARYRQIVPHLKLSGLCYYIFICQFSFYFFFFFDK